MRKCLNKYNFQPLFYAYGQQGDIWADESFYYQLSARGFVNTHSITDGQAAMDSTALTGSGAVGWLTDNLHLCDDYHYAIDLTGEKLTLSIGESINLLKKLKLILGTAQETAGLIQISGPTLNEDNTLTEEGTVTVVYYATRKTDGGTTYTVYSEPVKITFVDDSVTAFIPKTSITLSNDLVFNVYVPVSAELVSFMLDGVEYADLAKLNESIVTLSNGKQYYQLKVDLYSSEAARNIILEANLIVNGKDYTGTFNMGIPEYVEKVLMDTASTDVEKTLVKDILSYVRAAYDYFGKSDDAAMARINEILGENYDELNAPEFNGSLEAPTAGLSGVTFVLNSTPAIRFYIPESADPNSYKFYADGKYLPATSGNDTNGTYVEISVYAYLMGKTVTYTLDGVTAGSYHIRSYYEFAKTQNDIKLVTLVERFARYCESAENYRISVTEK
jgi:hypothetical protein